jgi:prolipoprotein diacylglyceryltransferase
LPWAVSFWGEFLHPVQLYDALAAIIGLIIVWRVRVARDGISAWMVVAWYSGARLLIDAFRGDATILENGYRVSQIIALIVLLIALWFIARKGATNAKEFEIQIDGERAGG